MENVYEKEIAAVTNCDASISNLVDGDYDCYVYVDQSVATLPSQLSPTKEYLLDALEASSSGSLKEKRPEPTLSLAPVVYEPLPGTLRPT
jgi:hypothetical protein